MELSVSILSIKENIVKKIDELNNLPIDYIHVDVMDGIFVKNRTELLDVVKNNCKKPIDVHLMVEDVEKYVEEYKKLNPTYITFHFETFNNIDRIINLIKDNNIKVGISVKPSTDVALLVPYLNKIDLVLVMTVEPGKGGQEFMSTMDYKIKDLVEIRKNNNFNYKIEVDGGINDKTINSVKDADIVVVGSYITCSSNYAGKIKTIKGEK